MSQNRLSILPFYDTLEEQVHRLSYFNGTHHTLYSDLSNTPPFQFVKPATNNPLHSFKLHRMETGVETELLSEFETVGLFMNNFGEENYADSGSTIQDPGVDTSSWGMSFALNTRQFRYLQIKVDLYDIGAVPTDFRCVIFDGSAGAELASVDLNIGAVLPTEKMLLFDFEEIVESTGVNALWLEVRSNGHFKPVGRDGQPLDYTPEVEKYGLALDLTTAPSTVAGAASDYDAYVRTWGAEYDYDLITYPASAAISTATPEGRYYAIMQDKDVITGLPVNTWYSEVFCIRDDVAGMIRVNYWHRYNFIFDGGMIKYDNGFRNFFYICADIVKPQYQEIIEARSINGVEQGLFTVSFKVRRFAFNAPEYFLDAIRVVFQHHDVTIVYKGKTMIVNKIQFIPTWGDLDNHGDFADVICEFRTNEIVTQRGDNVAPLPDPVGQGAWTGDGGLWTGDDGVWLGF